jgi:hypothetical protein
MGMALIGLGLIALDGRLFAKLWRAAGSPGQATSS